MIKKKESKKTVSVYKPMVWPFVLAVVLLAVEARFLREFVAIITLAVLLVCVMKAECVTDKFLAPNRTPEHNKQAKKTRVHEGTTLFLMFLINATPMGVLPIVSTVILILFIVAVFNTLKGLQVLNEMDN